MSFLHRNSILQEYRRQHREEAAQRIPADENVSSANDDEGQVLPDVAAFKDLGSPATLALPSMHSARRAKYEASDTRRDESLVQDHGAPRSVAAVAATLETSSLPSAADALLFSGALDVSEASSPRSSDGDLLSKPAGVSGEPVRSCIDGNHPIPFASMLSSPTGTPVIPRGIPVDHGDVRNQAAKKSYDSGGMYNVSSSSSAAEVEEEGEKRHGSDHGGHSSSPVQREDPVHLCGEACILPPRDSSRDIDGAGGRGTTALVGGLGTEVQSPQNKVSEQPIKNGNTGDGPGALADNRAPPSAWNPTRVKGDRSPRGGEEALFSPKSFVEVTGPASPFPENRSQVLSECRSATERLHMLSLSATTTNPVRVWDVEVDVDVDPSSTVMDSTRGSLRTALRISFIEAFLELSEEMQLEDRDTSGASALKGSAASRVPQAVTPKPLPPKRFSSISCVFSCCGGKNRGSTATKGLAQKAYFSEQGGGRKLSHAAAAAEDGASVEKGAEWALRVIRALKSLPLSLQNSTHRLMLLTVFNTLTNRLPWPDEGADGRTSPQRAASQPSSSTPIKWESIGFQGVNPATDVRATGVLGVLQILYLIDYYPNFTRRLWKLCRHPSALPTPSDGGAAVSSSATPLCVSDPFPCTGASESGRVGKAPPNELPFVLVCFAFTAVILDAAGRQLFDDEIEKRCRRFRAVGRGSKPTKEDARRPESHLSSSPGMYVCCQSYVGALALFEEAWKSRLAGVPDRHKGVSRLSATDAAPQRLAVADFGIVKAALRAQLLARGASKAMQEAARKIDSQEALERDS